MEVKINEIKEYRKRFSVYALFEKENGDTLRRFADIVRNGYEEASIDAYLIMINPGSCKEDKEQKKGNYRFYKDYPDVVKAVCDPAQKCVMSLMDTCDINKIRILNLSEYVCGNLKEALGKDDYFKDSIFSESREEELKKYMYSDAVCIASWGTNDDLRRYKEQAIATIGKERIIGYQKQDTRDKETSSYRYIKPWKIIEQKEIIAGIAEEYFKYETKKCKNNFKEGL